MRARTIAAYVFGTLVYVALPAPALAQCGCGYVEPTSFVADPSVAAVFLGTITDVSVQNTVGIVTFDVTRVWKGEVSARQVVYRAIRPPESRIAYQIVGLVTPFVTGRSYIVVAHTLNAAEQLEFGLETSATARLAHGYCGCGSLPFDIATRHLDELGPGRLPN